MSEEEFHRRLIQAILSGEIEDKDALQKAKVRLARELHLSRLPANSEVIERLDEASFRKVEDILKRKPVRTLSGVAVVAVMTSPAPCPHGRCIYCPGGVDNGSPQSYTGKEPAARRASFNEFDPFRQTRARIEQLEAIGHDTDKIDLIVMGGTFTSRPVDYQRGFVQGCFDAMNERSSDDLEQAHHHNESAPHRCIGMTVETRPDSFDQAMADHVMSLGTTRMEFGVQILDESILRAVGRGHGVEEVVRATQVAKGHGLKVCYHVMPGLPGSSPELDLERFALMFQDERFMPDMLKIYPTLVVKGTPLYDMWCRGEYEPYSTEKAAHVVAEMKRLVPRWARIQRIQRDIPVQLIEAGVDKSHLRELARNELRSRGISCQCIRCREVGLKGIRRFEREEVTVQRCPIPCLPGGGTVLVPRPPRTRRPGGLPPSPAWTRRQGSGAGAEGLRSDGSHRPGGKGRPAPWLWAGAHVPRRIPGQGPGLCGDGRDQRRRGPFLLCHARVLCVKGPIWSSGSRPERPGFLLAHDK